LRLIFFPEMALRTVSESLEEDEASLSVRRRRFCLLFLPSLRFFRVLRSSLLFFLLFLLSSRCRCLLLLLLEPRFERCACDSVDESLSDDELEEEEDDERERCRRRWRCLAPPERSKRRGLRLASLLRPREVGDRDLDRSRFDGLLLWALAPITVRGARMDASAATYALPRERLRD
jgi:hypothetical protein